MSSILDYLVCMLYFERAPTRLPPHDGRSPDSPAHAHRRSGRGRRVLLVRLRPLAEPALLRRLAQVLELPAAEGPGRERSQGRLVRVQALGHAALVRRHARQPPARWSVGAAPAEVHSLEGLSAQRRTEKVASPSLARSTTSRFFTCAAGGPRSSQTSIASTASSRPSSQTSTLPSGRFFTQPPSSSRSAVSRAYQRKPTPCTRPETRTCRQNSGMRATLASLRDSRQSCSRPS